MMVVDVGGGRGGRKLSWAGFLLVEIIILNRLTSKH